MTWSAEMRRSVSGLSATVTLALAPPPPGAEAAGADRTGDGVDRRIRLNDGGDLLQLALHQLKGARRVAADAALQLTGILLRKKSLGDHDVQINIEADGRDRTCSTMMRR